MDFLLQDPRPDIIQDSGLWSKLFRLCLKIDDTETGDRLLKRLWTLRSAGTMLKPTGDGNIKFVPIIDKGSDWVDEAHFEEMKIKHLKPYAKEIAGLLRKVVTNEQTE